MQTNYIYIDSIGSVNTNSYGMISWKDLRTDNWNISFYKQSEFVQIYNLVYRSFFLFLHIEVQDQRLYWCICG